MRTSFADLLIGMLCPVASMDLRLRLRLVLLFRLIFSSKNLTALAVIFVGTFLSLPLLIGDICLGVDIIFEVISGVILCNFLSIVGVFLGLSTLGDGLSMGLSGNDLTGLLDLTFGVLEDLRILFRELSGRAGKGGGGGDEELFISIFTAIGFTAVVGTFGESLFRCTIEGFISLPLSSLFLPLVQLVDRICLLELRLAH